MKRVLITLGIVTLVSIMAAPAFARHGGRGHWGAGSGPCWDRDQGKETLTDEQVSQLEELQESFYADTADIRHELWAKTDQLDILLNRSNPDADKAKSLQKEISDLRGQMAQKRLQRNMEARKIAPEASIGRSGQWHGCGRHMKKGPGGHRKGGDHGPCWK